MYKKPFLALVSLVTAVAFTAYIALDTFVIPHAYTAVENADSEDSDITDSSSAAGPSDVSYDPAGISSASAENSDNAASSSESAVVTDSAYKDGNISIEITACRENDTDIYVADIVLSAPEYLKTALAKGMYGKNITDSTSQIAKDNNAILAINGDYYGVQESGYVIRNGVIYRDMARRGQEDLAIYEDGSMGIVYEENISARQLLDSGVYNLLSFGPGLIENGEISVSETDEVAKAMASNPRTALGIIDNLHYVFVVADGRTDESSGLSLYQLAEFMQSLNVTTAYNLDGGGSSTMVFNGTVINNPTSTGKSHGHGSHSESSSSKERSVSDIVYIGY